LSNPVKRQRDRYRWKQNLLGGGNHMHIQYIALYSSFFPS